MGNGERKKPVEGSVKKMCKEAGVKEGELKGGGQRRKVTEVRGKIAYYLSREMGIPKLPVRFALAGEYMVHHPDVGGQKWNIQLMVVPVIPKLIKGTLFGE